MTHPIWCGATAQAVAPGPHAKSYLIDPDTPLLLPVERGTRVVVLTEDAYERLLSQAERCSDGACEVSEAVVEALQEVGGWDEIDGDGSPATVLADHIRDLPHRLAEHDPAKAAQALIAAGVLVPTVRTLPDPTPDTEAERWRVPQIWYRDEPAPVDARPLFRLVVSTEETAR